nr:zeatin O-glucosyltransferase-like [Tanacetum cinerariifolium]
MLETLSVREWAKDKIEGSGSYRATVVGNLLDSYQQFQYKLSCKLAKDHPELSQLMCEEIMQRQPDERSLPIIECAEDELVHAIQVLQAVLFYLIDATTLLIVLANVIRVKMGGDDPLNPRDKFGSKKTASGDLRHIYFGTILDASRVIEGKYIDLIEQEDYQGDQKLWALGPFNPVEITQDSSHKRHQLFDWLEKQSLNSVIYVSFGTTTSMDNKEIQEIALGLEKSEQRFLWVLRDADKGDIFEGEDRKIEPPKGFQERVGERGLVVGDWVPQLEVLGHPSTGGFMSHCGWNSCMESMTMGVPVAAWPMHSDQPRNAMLITKILNVGLYVRDWTQRDELVTSTKVEEVVRRLMASKEGGEIRNRAAELGAKVRQSVMDGGVTRMELDSFVAHVTR